MIYSLLYTVGRDDIYIPYMKTKNPKKGIGGSVWKTYDDAKKYASNNFRVYGVIARWNIDTELDPEGDGWHILKIASPLKNLNYD